jgi:hypothetical protein
MPRQVLQAPFQAQAQIQRTARLQQEARQDLVQAQLPARNLTQRLERWHGPQPVALQTHPWPLLRGRADTELRVPLPVVVLTQLLKRLRELRLQLLVHPPTLELILLLEKLRGQLRVKQPERQCLPRWHPQMEAVMMTVRLQQSPRRCRPYETKSKRICLFQILTLRDRIIQVVDTCNKTANLHSQLMMNPRWR